MAKTRKKRIVDDKLDRRPWIRDGLAGLYVKSYLKLRESLDDSRD